MRIGRRDGGFDREWFWAFAFDFEKGETEKVTIIQHIPECTDR